MRSRAEGVEFVNAGYGLPQTSRFSGTRGRDEWASEYSAHPEDDGASGFAEDPVFDPFGDDLEMTPGTIIEHDHFGRGSRLRGHRRGSGMRLRIEFDDYGSKQMLVSMSPMRIVGRIDE